MPLRLHLVWPNRYKQAAASSEMQCFIPSMSRPSAHDVIVGVVEGAAVGEDQLDVSQDCGAGLVRHRRPAVALAGSQPLPATTREPVNT